MQYEDIDFTGYDSLSSKADNPEICRDMCLNNPDCQFYSFYM